MNEAAAGGGHPIADDTAFALAPGTSFCRVAGRTMFLDVVGDRYFCLSPEGERAFTKLADAAPLDRRDLATLAGLTVAGPLTRSTAPQSIEACVAGELPVRSLLDEELPAPGAIGLALAAASLVHVPLFLRLFGLRRAVYGLRRRKAKSRAGSDTGSLLAVVAEFARLRYLATESDICLTRSLAVAHRQIGIGARPELVIAVKLQPFAAHAWVQCDGWLVNDRHEFVREFTPILVV